LGDAALNQDFDLKLAEECFVHSKDLGGLLLLYTSLCDAKGMERLAKMASEQGRNNIAFICLFLLNRIGDCTKLLCDTDRVPEAAFLTRTYAPSKIPEVLDLWKEDLKKVSAKAAEALADPAEYPELFPNLKVAVDVEKWLANATGGFLRNAEDYEDVKDNLYRDLVAEANEGGLLDDDDLGFDDEPEEEEAPVEDEEAPFEEEEAPAADDEEEEEAPVEEEEAPVEEEEAHVEEVAEPEAEPEVAEPEEEEAPVEEEEAPVEEEEAPVEEEEAPVEEVAEPEPVVDDVMDDIDDLDNLVAGLDDGMDPSMDDLNNSLADLDDMDDNWADDL